MDCLFRDIKNKIHQYFQTTYKGSNVFVIACDGNIGAGKSTLCRHLKNYITDELNDILVCHIEENVDKNTELFEKYLSNQREYGLEFQKWIIRDKIQQFLDKENPEKKNIVVIMDRSLLADKFVFFRNLLAKKLIGHEECREYENTFHCMSKKYPINLFYPDFHIILEASIRTVIERIDRRNRIGEKSVYNEEYLQMIEDFHNDMYKTFPVRESTVVHKHDNNTNLYTKTQQNL